MLSHETWLELQAAPDTVTAYSGFSTIVDIVPSWYILLVLRKLPEEKEEN